MVHPLNPPLRHLARLLPLLLAGLFFLLPQPSDAHPIPDIPVRGAFQNGGAASFLIEINPRCFDADPDKATALIKLQFENLSDSRKAELLAAAAELARKNLEIRLEPVGQIQPEFRFEFTGEGRKPLDSDESVVVITGTWDTRVPAGVTGWNVKSSADNKVSVVFQNVINGEPHPRVAVLFPGERSFTLDLTQLTGAVPTQAAPNSVPAAGGSGDLISTVWSFCKQGFRHVVPDGMDHILFVLGLFLMQRAVRPILLQVTTFTAAHSVTLALATLGHLSVPAKFVEPLIAFSIALVAAENIWFPRYSHKRLLIVFVFGLVHGLGFASALGDLSIPKGSELGALAGFNIGVEGGQIAVILLALALTGLIRKEGNFRRWVTIPGSALIGCTGLYWAAQRILN